MGNTGTRTDYSYVVEVNGVPMEFVSEEEYWEYLQMHDDAEIEDHNNV